MPTRADTHARLRRACRQCLYSIGDNHSFLTANRDPVEKMIEYLTHFFRPDRIEPGYDLSIAGGEGGARLSHSHEKQYFFVLQSLSLWREIAHDMFRLWCLAEEDLLSADTRYTLRDTGQGRQRVQQAPHLSMAMRNILHATQQRCAARRGGGGEGGGQWIGSSVVHLGDDNVPNALMFIDKYTQVASILNPIVIVLRNIPGLLKDEIVAEYIQATFGGGRLCGCVHRVRAPLFSGAPALTMCGCVWMYGWQTNGRGAAERLIKDILLDFFRSAFDGSGA